VARILILSEPSEHLKPLWSSLAANHELNYVQNMAEAMEGLQENKFDLIICSAHLNLDDNKSIFDFIRSVKNNAELRGIPLLCFSKTRTAAATFLNSSTEKAALLFGADEYLTMDSFCGGPEKGACEGCPFLEKLCNFESLRHAIEDLIDEGAIGICQRPSGTDAVASKQKITVSLVQA